MKLAYAFRPFALPATILSLAVLSGAAALAQAQTQSDLRFATSYKLMTLDPHFANLNENTSLLSHIYERLVYQDEKLALKEGLAVSWSMTAETRWEFKLREGVRFHDGSSFTADDVVYSIERIRNFLQPPSGGYRSYVTGIKAVSAKDPLTVVIETDGRIPNLPLLMSSVFIMHRPASGFQTTEELNSGRASVGSGPYKFESWSSGEMLHLTRNDQHWAGRPAWPAVTFRVMESPAARVAALSTGDVDVADSVPARDVAALKQRGADVASTSAARINFLQFDVEKQNVSGVTDKSGTAIPNPFRNIDVRRALALATDRTVIVEKILSGYGSPASQFFPEGLPGTSENLKAEAPDYDAAKAILAKAGYPDGFNVVLAGPAGRYPGDGESLQAVAQSWARIGVSVQPQASPFSVFNTKRAAGEYAAWYGGTSGEAVDIILRAVVASPDKERGTGALNFGRYRNPSFDALLETAEDIEDGGKRDDALAQATELVMKDQPIIPLYHFHHIVGYGAKVGSYVIHPRGWTTAMQTIAATE
ncbi:ABC transporter substrate-binding protein (plasmid) [Agrobacterium tumefaciens]|nr:ABC transporter substrate-binding protein [Agrobacterium tumefaciens]